MSFDCIRSAASAMSDEKRGLPPYWFVPPRTMELTFVLL